MTNMTGTREQMLSVDCAVFELIFLLLVLLFILCVFASTAEEDPLLTGGGCSWLRLLLPAPPPAGWSLQVVS